MRALNLSRHRYLFSSLTDTSSLSSTQINQILRKKEKQNIKILYKDEVPIEDPEYNENIEQKVSKLVSKSQTEIQQQESPETPEKPIENTLPEARYYKYGLPIPNLDPGFKTFEELLQEERDSYLTLNEKMWKHLQINEETPYGVYELQLQQKFNYEMDMYGDIQDNQAIRQKTVEEHGNEIIPWDAIKDEEHMDYIRSLMSININMPGTMENEHPHRFLQNLRPIEEFRNTPLIPISDRQMREHKEMLERYHRSAFMFEVKKETIANYAFLMVAGYIAYIMFKMALDRDDQRELAYERMKLRRQKD